MAADTCIWIAWRDPADPEQPAIEELLRLRREGRVEIAKTDTVDTERTDGVPDAKATDRLLETAGIIELHGPVVVGHSRWDHAVFASDEDSDRIDGVFAVLFPDSDRNAMDRTSIHKLRDALHIATAIRYGYDVFVTAETRLLKRPMPYGGNGASKYCVQATRCGGWNTESNWNGSGRNVTNRTIAGGREPNLMSAIEGFGDEVNPHWIARHEVA